LSNGVRVRGSWYSNFVPVHLGPPSGAFMLAQAMCRFLTLGCTLLYLGGLKAHPPRPSTGEEFITAHEVLRKLFVILDREFLRVLVGKALPLTHSDALTIHITLRVIQRHA